MSLRHSIKRSRSLLKRSKAGKFNRPVLAFQRLVAFPAGLSVNTTPTVAFSGVFGGSISRAFSDNAPQAAEAGHNVTISFVGTKEGKVFDSSEASQPLTFKLGSGQVITGLDDAVKGMVVGEKKTTVIPIEKGYGKHLEEMVIKIDSSQLPEDVKVGDVLRMRAQDGSIHAGKVVELPAAAEASETAEAQGAQGEGSGPMALIDMNHPLAGHELTFELELTKVADPPAAISELGIETIKEGDGVTFPKQGDHLTMHYCGTLVDGTTKFDSSRDRDDPFKFQIGVGQVIKGWDEGVIQMSLGQRALIKIPSAMGYGERGAGASIPPNSDLIFDVELLKIN